jgi:hypothetical protein
VLREVWRASGAQPGSIAEQLGAEVIGRIENVARGGQEAAATAMEIRKIILTTKQNNFAIEIARRAAIQAVLTKSSFAEHFFSEASNYLVSRDVSGFVGKGARNENVRELSEFKREVTSKTAELVRSANSMRGDMEWKQFAKTVLSRLQVRDK